jgi:glutaconate CoA-transferase, subunit B
MTPVVDLMTCALMREVRDGDVVGVGLGTPLALCAALAARRAGAPGAEILVAGALSPDADLLTCLRGAQALAGRTPGFVPHLDTMDMAERRAMTLQFLRPAQVGPDGAMNTSRVAGPDGRPMRLPGGLATADVPRLLPRLVIYHPDHRPRSLPARPEHVTGPPGSATRVVTDLCVIALEAGGPRIASLHPGAGAADVVAATGFRLDAPDDVPTTPPPTPAERAALDEVDPHGLRGLEHRATRREAGSRLHDLLATEAAHA